MDRTTETITVDEETVLGIQLMDTERQVLDDVCSDLLSKHMHDADGSFMASPVLARVREEASMALARWERAKDAMAEKYIPEGKRALVQGWNLDYATCELMLVLKPAASARLGG